VEGTEYTELFWATKLAGTYNHAAMIAYHDDQLLVSFKNSPKDEDQDGQRVLYTQSVDGGATFTPLDTVNTNCSAFELFPSMNSSSNPKVALFATPHLILNGRMYATASPTQFELYPDEFVDRLLVRRVFPGLGQMGPIFWYKHVYRRVSRAYSCVVCIGFLSHHDVTAASSSSLAALALTRNAQGDGRCARRL